MMSVHLNFWHLICQQWEQDSNSSLSLCDLALMTMAHQPPLIVFPTYTASWVRRLMEDGWLQHNEVFVHFNVSVHNTLYKHYHRCWTGMVYQYITCHHCGHHVGLIFPHWTMLCGALSRDKWLAQLWQEWQVISSHGTGSHLCYASNTSVHAIHNTVAHQAVLETQQYTYKPTWYTACLFPYDKLIMGMVTSWPLFIVPKFPY